ncbi:Glycosyltransferase Family 1 protein [Rhizophagus diaphanus]|nr:Glycosyltransferase Family 1 protein [Rhizophagus diaphanus] [Rhizophagus sp. MUCL 43196]
MNKKNFTFILSLLLLNLIFRVEVNTATQDSYYIPTNADVDHPPKNILVGSYVGGRSHIKPMLDIAAVLSERGHNVILTTSGNYTPASEYPTIKQHSFGPAFDVKNIRSVANLMHKEFDFTKFVFMYEMSFNTYEDAFVKYKNVAIDQNIDLFFCHAMVNDACLDAGHALNKPVVGFISYLNAMDIKTYKSDPLFHCNVSLENESFLERFKCTIVQPLRMLNMINDFSKQLNDLRSKMGIEQVFMSPMRLAKNSLVLIDTFFGFELPQTVPPNIQEIGPVLSKHYPPLTPELSDFINGHKRVLYVAFGSRFFTTIENNSKLLQSFIEAINKKIVDGVVWALSQTPEDDFYPTLSLSDGSEVQTSLILNNKHPHIHILKFAPQFAVLNHTNTKLFFSHGGAGSTHESLFTGTPMLVIPLGGDQLGNAQKLELAGVALSVNKFTLDVNDILNKIDFLLKDEDVKKNSKRMKYLARINSKRKYRAADLIEYILYRNNLDNDSNKELKDWLPASTRMGFIRGNNYDIYGTILGIILGLIGGILWITIKSIKFIAKKISPSPNQKPKKE